MQVEHKPENIRIGFEKEAMPFLDKLYNFASRITGGGKNAYKLLEETYIKALRFYNHLDESIDFESWIFRIIRNTYSESFSKKLSPQESDYEKIKTRFYQIYTSEGMDHLKNEFFNRLNEEEISSGLASMTDDFKMVIVLSSVMKFNYEDISDFVDVPSGVVRSRIHRGRKNLFIQLYDYAADRGLIKNVIREKDEMEVKEDRDYYYIAALADNELKNTSGEEKIREAIAKTPELIFEYNVQLLVKNLLNEKLKFISAPTGIRKKLQRKISSVSKSIR